MDCFTQACSRENDCHCLRKLTETSIVGGENRILSYERTMKCLFRNNTQYCVFMRVYKFILALIL